MWKTLPVLWIKRKRPVRDLAGTLLHSEEGGGKRAARAVVLATWIIRSKTSVSFMALSLTSPSNNV